MAVYVHEFAWDDAYFSCGCTSPDDTPLFNVSGWKLVRSISKGKKKYNDMGNIMKIMERE